MLRQFHGGKSLFNRFWDNWIYTYKGIKLDSHLKLYTNINSKWIRSLNVIAIRVLKENTSINLYDLRLGSRVLDTMPKQQKKNQIGLHQNFKVSASKVSLKQVKRKSYILYDSIYMKCSK